VQARRGNKMNHKHHVDDRHALPVGAAEIAPPNSHVIDHKGDKYEAKVLIDNVEEARPDDPRILVLSRD